MKKRESNQQHIGDILQAYVQQHRWGDKLTAVDLKQAWGTIMGEMIHNHTTELELRKKVLIIKLDSSVLRQELSYSKQKIVDKINDHFGRPIVEDVLLA